MNPIFRGGRSDGRLVGHERISFPAQQKWRRIIEHQQAGGQTAAAYCREHRIAPASFFAWKRRLRAVPAGGFIEVRAAVATAPVWTDGIEVSLPGDRRLQVRPGFNPDLLIELIRLLEGLS